MADIYKIKIGEETHNLPFLPLSGGTLQKNSASILTINNTNNSTSSGSQYSGVRFSWNGSTVSGIHGKNGSETLWRSNASFANAYEIFDTGNYTAWVPKKDGTGASGTWNINVTGSATTATSATYASRLGDSSAYHTKSTIDNALASKHPLMLPFELSSNISYDALTKKISNASSQNSWNRGAYSKEGYYNGCYVSFKPSQTNMYAMIGLNSDPTTDHNYTSIDYCWYIQSGGALCVYENGTQRSVSKTSYEVGDELTVVYDGRNVNYFCNGTCYRRIGCTPGTKLYFDSSLYNAGSIYDVNYGPLTNTWPTNLDQLTNGPGYITGITKAMVTNALGYTPYNSTNPSGYITASGSITGNAATADSATKATNDSDGNAINTTYLKKSGGVMSGYISWQEGVDGNDVSNWLTERSNYGIKILSAGGGSSEAPSTYSTGLQVRGRYGFQIASQGGDIDNFFIRNISRDNRTWKTLIHSDNIGSYALTSLPSHTHTKSEITDFSHSHDYLPLTGGNVTGPITSDSGYVIMNPIGASYHTRESTKTGCITINLPSNVGDTMCSMWIDVYNYVEQTSFSVHVGGYTYQNNTWQHRPFAMVYGATHKVRLGHNGTNFCIYIGEDNSSWTYPQISVRSVTIGYNTTVDAWKKSWSITFETSPKNVTYTTTSYAYTNKIFSLSAPNTVTDTGYSDTDTGSGKVPTLKFLSFWNGAYSGTTSNLAYCNKGAFGTIVTKAVGDYLPISGGTLTGQLSITSSGHTLTLGSRNSSWCHYQTSAPSHWFNTNVACAGDFYGGTDYNRRLAYVDELNSNTNSFLASKYTFSSGMTYDDTTKKIQRTTTGTAWNKHACSNYGYYSGCYVSFKAGQNSSYIMVGLNSDPLTDANYESLDYCWYIQRNGALNIYESKVGITVSKTTYNVGDEFKITYDGQYIRYFCNGVLYRSIERAVGDKLYFDSSFYEPGGIYDVEFGPIATHVNHATTATSASSASSVAWTNVSGKPTAFSPAAHDHTVLKDLDNYSFKGINLPVSFPQGISCGFVQADAIFPSYGSVLTCRTYSGGGGTLQLYAPYSATYGGERLMARFGNYDSANGNSWTALKEIAWLEDIPSLSGYSKKASAETLSGAKTFSAAATFSAGFTSNSDVTITGKVSARDGFFETSDERLKDIQAPLATDLEKLSHLRKVYFNFKKDPSKTHIGVIAQDIKELYPEIVNETDEGTLNVDYSKLSVIALDAIDTLHKENVEIKKENEEIKKRLEKIESLLLNQ